MAGDEAEDQRPRPRVCRRLFAEEPSEPGVVSAEKDNLFNMINEQINRDLDEASAKWNFDFRHEVPMDGRWDWERVGPDGPLPGPPRSDGPPREPPSAPQQKNDQPVPLERNNQ